MIRYDPGRVKVYEYVATAAGPIVAFCAARRKGGTTRQGVRKA